MLKTGAKEFYISTCGKGLYLFTDDVTGWIAKESNFIKSGLLTLWCCHTSASLTVQENFDPSVREDVRDFFEDLVSESRRYRHDDEGPDDMPAHLRSMLTNVQLSIPIIDGKLALGTWQGIYLFEHRRHPHKRRVVANYLGH